MFEYAILFVAFVLVSVWIYDTYKSKTRKWGENE